MSDFQPVRCAHPSLSDNDGLIVSEQEHPPVITGGVLVCVCVCVCMRACVRACVFVAKSGWGNGEVNGDAVSERTEAGME